MGTSPTSIPTSISTSVSNSTGDRTDIRTDIRQNLEVPADSSHSLRNRGVTQGQRTNLPGVGTSPTSISTSVSTNTGDRTDIRTDIQAYIDRNSEVPADPRRSLRSRGVAQDQKTVFPSVGTSPTPTGRPGTDLSHRPSGSTSGTPSHRPVVSTTVGAPGPEGEVKERSVASNPSSVASTQVRRMPSAILEQLEDVASSRKFWTKMRNSGLTQTGQPEVLLRTPEEKTVFSEEVPAGGRKSNRTKQPIKALTYGRGFIPSGLAGTVTLPEKPSSVLPPKTLGEAKKSLWWEGYRLAIEEEISNLEKLGCWERVNIRSIPRGTNILLSKFVFDDKRGPDGKLLKFKARMVAMGFTQVAGVDYNETFASVMVTKSFRTLLVIWNLDPNLSMEHWDIKQAFINAPLDEIIYVRPVSGFERESGEILKLKKALYGTKQAAHAWQKFLTRILRKLGGIPHPKDDCVFIFREGETSWLFLSTHVDDIFVLFNQEGLKIRDSILIALNEEVTVENRGELSWALNTKVERDSVRGILKISQEEYVNELIRTEHFDDIGLEDTPTFDKGSDSHMSADDLPKTDAEKEEVAKFPFQSIIGKFWWLALVSRPDIVYAVHRCACWQNRPSQKLKRWVLRIVRYLKKTKTLGLVFERRKFDIQTKPCGQIERICSFHPQDPGSNPK